MFLNTAYAQTAKLDSLYLKVLSNIINPIITLLMVGALTYFVYGVVVFIANFSNEEKRTKGKSHMLWGIVGLSIMVLAQAIVNFIAKSIGVDLDADIINPV